MRIRINLKLVLWISQPILDSGNWSHTQSRQPSSRHQICVKRASSHRFAPKTLSNRRRYRKSALNPEAYYRFTFQGISFPQLFLSSVDWVTGVRRTYPNWNSISAMTFDTFPTPQAGRTSNSWENRRKANFNYNPTPLCPRGGMTENTRHKSPETWSELILRRCTEAGKRIREFITEKTPQISSGGISRQ